MDRYIKVTQMLDAMKETLASGRPKPFRIGFLKADKTRGTGGEYCVVTAVLSQGGKKSGSTDKRIIVIELQGVDSQSVHIDNILYFNDQSLS